MLLERILFSMLLLGGVFTLVLLTFRRVDTAFRITISFALALVWAFIGHRQNGWPGAIFLPLAIYLFFLASVFLVSRHLFPIKGRSQQWDAFWTLLSYILAFNRPSSVIENGKVSERIPGDPTAPFGSGVILTGPTHAAVMETPTRFSRVIRPGVGFVGRTEEIKEAVDLRWMLKFTSLKTETQDGVPIHMGLFCIPFINRGDPEDYPGEDFPILEEALLQAVYRQRGADQEGEAHYWHDFAMYVVTNHLRQELREYKFDDLFEYEGQDPPRVDIIKKLNFKPPVKLKQELAEHGIGLMFAGFGTLKISEEQQEQILEQRIASWQATWAAWTQELRARGEAAAERIVRRARSRAQWELAQGIANGLEAAQRELQGQDVKPDELIAWQMLSTMERMSADPRLRAWLPQETLHAINLVWRELQDAE